MRIKWIKISVICVLFLLLILLVCCNVISAIPVDGIWICEDDPYVVLDLTKRNQTPTIELVYNGEIEKFNIGYGDEGRFKIYPLLSEGEGVHASDILWEGYIVQYGNRVHIKSDDVDLNYWLTELEMISF